MAIAVQIAFALLMPAVALRASERVKPLGWIGPVGLCYLAGLFIANLPGLTLNRDASMRIAEVAVPLSIPLLLFAARLEVWRRLARPLVTAFVLALVATLISAAIYGVVFRDRLAEAWKLAAMLVGVYVGGTANMSVIGLALEVKEEVFVLVNASDLLWGGAYLLFLLTIAQRVLHTFLPKFTRATLDADTVDDEQFFAWTRRTVLHAAGAFAIAVAFAGVAAGLSFLLFGALQIGFVLLLITSMAIGASFVPFLRENVGGHATGEYLLLVFCVAMGSLASFSELAAADATVLLMVAAVQFTAIALHFALCALFRVDADTVLITSTATIFGPAFIAPVARSLRNRELMVGGIASALAGLAVANYLGLWIAYLLKP